MKHASSNIAVYYKQQLAMFEERETTPFYKTLAELDGTHDETTVSVDLDLLKRKMFEKIGYQIELDGGIRISEHKHGEMILNKILPLSMTNDHDLVIHIMPILGFKRNIAPAFLKVSQMSTGTIRAWGFEMLSVMLYCDSIGESKEYILSIVNQGISKMLRRTSKAERDEYRFLLNACANFISSSEEEFTLPVSMLDQKTAA